MGLLNWYLSDERKANVALYSNERIVAVWKEYQESFPKKKELVSGLSASDEDKVNILLSLLKTEMIEIETDEVNQNQILAELNHLSHSRRMQLIERMEQCLNYHTIQLEYAHKLVRALWRILQAELQIAELLQRGSAEAEKLIEHLKKQIELEEATISKIIKVPDFHSFFVSLAKDEHFFRELDKKKGSLFNRMRGRMGRIFDQEITEGITYEWAMETLERTKAVLATMTAAHDAGELDAHPDADVEFVNGDEFYALVRGALLAVRERNDQERHSRGELAAVLRKDPSDKLILTFTNQFREWFNYVYTMQ